MLTVSPKPIARVAHFPRTTTLHPKTPLLLINRNPTLWIQASPNLVDVQESVEVLLPFRTVLEADHGAILFDGTATFVSELKTI